MRTTTIYKKVNLNQPFSQVLTDAILAYRLNLHESINDYLMAADLDDIKYFYRVKTADISQVMESLDGWQEKFGLKNWYLRDKDGYVGICVYFKNKSNFYYPWG